MTVVLDLANGQTEIFTTENYVISKDKKFHPLICKVTVFDNGRKIAMKKRFCIWWYKTVTFNSFKVQSKLKELNNEYPLYLILNKHYNYNMEADNED